MKQKQPEFNMFLAEALHESLNSISPYIPSVVYFYLEKNGSIKSDRHIKDPEAFEESLKEIFGFGAKVIEKKILESLYVKLQAPRKIKDDFKFSEELKNAQKLLDTVKLAIKRSR